MIEIDILTMVGKTKRASCISQKGESIKVLQVSDYQSGQVKISASADNEAFEVCKFADESDMTINGNMQIELPVGNYVIKAEFDGEQDIAPKITLS